MTGAQAPGKVILFGEHAVVYGRPAIAAPVTEVQAHVTVEDTNDRPGVTICAPDVGQCLDLASAPEHEPLSATVHNTLAHLGVPLEQVHLALTIRSSIPVASGLGSGAAVATAIVRALGNHLGRPLDPAAISSIVYETEKIHHGTPSGIDNTVVTFERPVYFRKGQPITTFDVKRPFWLAIADTGVPSLTRVTVSHVRAAWQSEPERYNALFDQIGALVDTARQAIEEGQVRLLGPLMNENQRLLRELEVSSLELEKLIGTARQAGAAGAKLCGGGGGGNAIALIEPEQAPAIRGALLQAGAKNVIVTRIG